jgi:2-polyprenyl-3-methyl-5-hydroxy-6-metoxy-1,4-benzoquinol methylase
MNSSIDLEQVWTPQRISRFWDMVAEEPRLHHLYFSRNAAKYILNLARLYGMANGKVLDYGSGPGYLSKELVENGFETTAVEFSPISAKKTNELLSGKKKWNGCFVRNSISNPRLEKFSWIFSIEAFEHLRDEWVDGYFKDLNRLLDINGSLFISTPNSENLDNELIICPCCETKFHRWGHLRSVTPEYLKNVAGQYGFEVELCHGINLEKVQSKKRTKIELILDKIVIKKMPNTNLDRFNNLEEMMAGTIYRPNLVLIGKKVKEV